MLFYPCPTQRKNKELIDFVNQIISLQLELKPNLIKEWNALFILVNPSATLMIDGWIYYSQTAVLFTSKGSFWLTFNQTLLG